MTMGIPKPANKHNGVKRRKRVRVVGEHETDTATEQKEERSRDGERWVHSRIPSDRSMSQYDSMKCLAKVSNMHRGTRWSRLSS